MQSAQNQNRLHAAHGSSSTPGCVVQDLKRSVASLDLRITTLRCEAMTLVRQEDLLRKRYELLVSIPGIAQVSAMQLLAELSTLPSDLTVREWVAHSSLDPAHENIRKLGEEGVAYQPCGKSSPKKSALQAGAGRIPLRSPRKGFLESLLARNKARLQALIAVARKLLHAIYGIFRSGLKYEGAKLFPRITLC